MNINYRTAKKADCLRMAELINIASGGVVEFLFHDLVPERTPTQIVAYNLKSAQGAHTYKNSIVAEAENQVVGMALSFPAHYHRITAEMRQFFPKDRMDHLSDFYAARIDGSLFLDALCVDQTLRRNGIGGQLISLTKEKAKKDGMDLLSLIVFADNTKALSVYHRHGFEFQTPVKLDAHEYIPHGGGCFLMKCHINN